jgi:hypothetical protein
VLERFAMNAFELPGTTPRGAYPTADAAFMRALGARAPALTEVRLLANVRGVVFSLSSTICWRDALVFLARCRRDAYTGALHLRAVTVSIAVRITRAVPDLHAALDMAEREALAVRQPSADNVRALAGTQRLFLHAHVEGGDQTEGPV